MDMDVKLLEEVRARRDEARKRLIAARTQIDELETRYHELDDTLATLQGIKREHEAFSESASDILGD